MFFKVTSERLLRAGFQLEKFEDGSFWVIEKAAGAEADRLLRICGRALIDFDVQAVADLILLQCGSDFSEPALYIDGFLWNLTRRDFTDILFLLLKTGRAKPKTPPGPISGTKP